MRAQHTKFDVVLTALLLVAGIAEYGIVLFFVDDPELRLRFGLLALVPIVWAVAWLARETATAGRPHPHNVPRRRYIRLRSAMREFIAEVTRLNWAVIEVRRGPTNHDAAVGRVVAIEEQMSERFERVKLAAGVPSSEPGPDAESSTSSHT